MNWSIHKYCKQKQSSLVNSGNDLSYPTMNIRDMCRLFINTLVISFILLMTACYSFKGVTIPEEVTTFYIQDFEISNRALKAPRQLGTVFTDQFKRKILRESRLNFTETNPDVVFSGEISRYAIRSVAPQPDETTAFSRLDIAIQVDYIDNLNEENNWSKSFSDFRNFDRNQNFLDVQDQLVKEIFEQISEDIFNATFSNW